MQLNKFIDRCFSPNVIEFDALKFLTINIALSLEMRALPRNKNRPVLAVVSCQSVTSLKNSCQQQNLLPRLNFTLQFQALKS